MKNWKSKSVRNGIISRLANFKGNGEFALAPSMCASICLSHGSPCPSNLNWMLLLTSSAGTMEHKTEIYCSLPSDRHVSMSCFPKCHFWTLSTQLRFSASSVSKDSRYSSRSIMRVSICPFVWWWLLRANYCRSDEVQQNIEACAKWSSGDFLVSSGKWKCKTVEGVAWPEAISRSASGAPTCSISLHNWVPTSKLLADTLRFAV